MLQNAAIKKLFLISQASVAFLVSVQGGLLQAQVEWNHPLDWAAQSHLPNCTMNALFSSDGKYQEIHGKSTENPRKIHGNSTENIRKIRKSTENPRTNPRKISGKSGKSRKIQGKSGK
jgi:hypothetical protein